MLRNVDDNPGGRNIYQPIKLDYVNGLIAKFGGAITNWAEQNNLPLPQFLEEPEMLFPVGYKAEPIGAENCGYFGCVYKSEDSSVVVKITTDQNEAQLIQALLFMEHTGGFRPGGIVKYHSIAQIASKFYGLRPYILWRDAATEIGGWEGTRESDEVSTRAAVLTDDYHHASRALMDMDIKLEKSMSLNAYWTKMRQLIRLFDGVREGEHELNHVPEFSRRIYRCRELADAMEFFPSFAPPFAGPDPEYNFDISLLGQTLKQLIDHRIILADIHYGNIGERSSDPGVKIITDPGLAIILDRELTELELPQL